MCTVHFKVMACDPVLCTYMLYIFHCVIRYTCRLPYAIACIHACIKCVFVYTKVSGHCVIMCILCISGQHMCVHMTCTLGALCYHVYTCALNFQVTV